MEEQLVAFIGTFATFASLGIPFVTELLFKYWDPGNKTLKSIITFIVALILTVIVYFLGTFFGIGFLVGASIFELVLTAFGAGLVATFSWINVKWIKVLIETLTKSKKRQQK